MITEIDQPTPTSARVKMLNVEVEITGDEAADIATAKGVATAHTLTATYEGNDYGPVGSIANVVFRLK